MTLEIKVFLEWAWKVLLVHEDHLGLLGQQVLENKDHKVKEELLENKVYHFFILSKKGVRVIQYNGEEQGIYLFTTVIVLGKRGVSGGPGPIGPPGYCQFCDALRRRANRGSQKKG